MEIIYKNGDLLKQTDIDVIAHQANCLNTMSAGIALAIKNKFPEAYQVDQATKKGDRSKLGTFTITKNTTPKIANLYAQYVYYPRNIRHTDYDAMRSALDKLGVYMIENNLKTLGLPHFIGAGLGGGDWNVIEGIIQDFSDKYKDIQVYIVKLI